MQRKIVDISALPRMLQQLVGEQLALTLDFIAFDPDVAAIDATPDAFILARKPATRDLRDQLLKYPGCSVVVLSHIDDRFDTYELQICHRSHSDTSMQELIEGLRVSLASSFREVDGQWNGVARCDQDGAVEASLSRNSAVSGS